MRGLKTTDSVVGAAKCSILFPDKQGKYREFFGFYDYYWHFLCGFPNTIT